MLSMQVKHIFCEHFIANLSLNINICPFAQQSIFLLFIVLSLCQRTLTPYSCELVLQLCTLKSSLTEDDFINAAMFELETKQEPQPYQPNMRCLSFCSHFLHESRIINGWSYLPFVNDKPNLSYLQEISATLSIITTILVS